MLFRCLFAFCQVPLQGTPLQNTTTKGTYNEGGILHITRAPQKKRVRVCLPPFKEAHVLDRFVMRHFVGLIVCGMHTHVLL